MTKLSIEDVQEALKVSKVDPDTQDKVLNYLEKVANEEKKEKEENKQPRQKAQMGVILIDEINELKTENISALIYQIPQDASHDAVLDNIKKSIAEFNQSEKGQKSPVKSVTEAFSVIKPKIFKNNGGLVRKTKEIIRCLKTLNKI